MKSVERITLTCKQCGQPYQRTHAQLNVKPSNFCSKACLFKFQKTSTEVKCCHCGKPCIKKPCEIKKGNIFCSQVCYKQKRIEGAKPETYLKKGSIHIHRIVAEKKIGRKLRKGEIVHHKDKNRKNNKPKNVQVMKQGRHAQIHFSGTKQTEAQIKKRVESRRATIKNRTF